MIRLGEIHAWATTGRVPGRVPRWQDKLRALAIAAAIALGALLLAPAPAQALTGGAGPTDPDPRAPWASVGSLSVQGRLFSAVLIDRQHVLTAAHVVAGAQPGQVVFRSALGQGFQSAATAIHVNPAYRGDTRLNEPGDPSVHDDLAIVRLARPAPTAIPLARLHRGDLQGHAITLVSHGGSTTLWHVGENQVDVVFRDFLGRPATYLFDFDGPDLASNRIGPAVPANGTLGLGREATIDQGDSGSAAFVRIDGQWWLAGINTFQVGFAPPPEGGPAGRGGGGVLLAPQWEWVRGVLERAVSAGGR